MVMNKTLALGILPVSRFLNGHTGSIQLMDRVQRVTPLMYHATYECADHALVASRCPFPCLLDPGCFCS